MNAKPSPTKPNPADVRDLLEELAVAEGSTELVDVERHTRAAASMHSRLQTAMLGVTERLTQLERRCLVAADDRERVRLQLPPRPRFDRGQP